MTYTTLIDPTHRVSSLYNLVNVPSGIWVDEEGRIVRINEGTYSRAMHFGSTVVGSDDYRPAVRDWVLNGSSSRYVWSPREVADRIRRRTSDEALAEPTFKLGVHFHRRGDEERARGYWAEAQRLFPDSWNFHRQDWHLTEGMGGPRFMEKREALGDEPYYAPLELEDAP